MIRMVKADEGMKVLALCERSNNPLIMLNNAAKTANAYGKKQLTERLQRRITAIQEEEMAEAEMMMEEPEESPASAAGAADGDDWEELADDRSGHSKKTPQAKTMTKVINKGFIIVPFFKNLFCCKKVTSDEMS